MFEISETGYLWIKAFHIISVIAWMAGLLYLPRLFVYHSNASVGSELSETLKIMESRLLRGIMNPAMLFAIIFGGLLVHYLGEDLWTDRWAFVKAACVIGLIVFHMKCSKWRRIFANDSNTKPDNFYRKVNEIPTVLMMLLVISVIVRPF